MALQLQQQTGNFLREGRLGQLKAIYDCIGKLTRVLSVKTLPIGDAHTGRQRLVHLSCLLLLTLKAK